MESDCTVVVWNRIDLAFCSLTVTMMDGFLIEDKVERHVGVVDCER